MIQNKEMLSVNNNQLIEIQTILLILHVVLSFLN